MSPHELLACGGGAALTGAAANATAAVAAKTNGPQMIERKRCGRMPEPTSSDLFDTHLRVAAPVTGVIGTNADFL
jgi:hypothetical protein